MASEHTVYKLLVVLQRFDSLLSTSIGLEFVNKKDLEVKSTIPWYADNEFLKIIDHLYSDTTDITDTTDTTDTTDKEDKLSDKEFCRFSNIFKEKLYITQKVPKYHKMSCILC